jgi:hypothetical protein
MEECKKRDFYFLNLFSFHSFNVGSHKIKICENVKDKLSKGLEQHEYPELTKGQTKPALTLTCFLRLPLNSCVNKEKCVAHFLVSLISPSFSKFLVIVVHLEARFTLLISWCCIFTLAPTCHIEVE